MAKPPFNPLKPPGQPPGPGFSGLGFVLLVVLALLIVLKIFGAF
jgi:hypothetical protein